MELKKRDLINASILQIKEPMKKKEIFKEMEEFVQDLPSGSKNLLLYSADVSYFTFFNIKNNSIKDIANNILAFLEDSSFVTSHEDSEIDFTPLSKIYEISGGDAKNTIDLYYKTSRNYIIHFMLIEASSFVVDI